MNQTHTMKCPYCVSEIDDQSLVCKVCHRDLYLLRPLLEKVADLENKAAKVPELEAEIESLRLQVITTQVVPDSSSGQSLVVRLAWGGGTTIALLGMLLLAHWLIIILYDLTPLYLRIVSLLLPMPLGYFFASRWHLGLGSVVWLAVLLSGFAVVGMSWLTSLVDFTPVLPQSWLEWREFVEYASSVMFSVVTGFLLCRAKRNPRGVPIPDLRKGGGVFFRLAKWMDVGGSAASLQARVEHLQSLWRTVTALGASLLSIYTGLRGIIG